MTGWLDLICPENATAVPNGSIWKRLPALELDQLENLFQLCTRLTRLYIYAHLVSCALGSLSRRARGFIKTVQPLLTSHETLSEIMSKCSGGYHPNTYPGYWDAIRVTFVASVKDRPKYDGVRLNIEKVIDNAEAAIIDWGLKEDD